jgi:hypothetical protein
VEASRKYLLEKRKQDRENERSQDRMDAELMNLRLKELDMTDQIEKEHIKLREQEVKEYQRMQAEKRRELAGKEYQLDMA